jgi:RNA polymerase sigma-70 factor, ECF subfamily
MAGNDSVARASVPPAEGAPEARPPVTVPPFATIYRQYFDFVWSSVRHLGIGAEAIDDVVQDAFIVIHAKLHTIEQPESLRSWIYGVVRRTASGYRRNRKVRDGSGLPLVDSDMAHGSVTTTPLDLVEHNADLKLLSSLLAEIDEPKREVFVLSEIQELTMPEIAEALQIPVNTAYSRLRAARAAFEAGLARRAARQKEKGLR